MYFPNGWVREVTSESPVEQISFSGYGRVAAILTKTSLSIFQLTCKGFKHYASEKIEAERFIWKEKDTIIVKHPNSKTLSTWKIAENKIFKVNQFDAQDYGKIISICHNGKNILVGTQTGYLVIISCEGKVLQGVSLDFLHGNISSSVMQIISLNDQYFVLLSDGSVGIIREVKSQLKSNYYSFELVKRRELLATTIAVNERMGYLAIGTKNGNVLLFDVYGNEFIKELSGQPTHTSEISCLSFTRDGYVLAVAYKSGGKKVFSTLFSSIILDTCSKNTSETFTSEYQKPIESLSWDYEGYNLFSSHHESCSYFFIPFFKSILTKNMSEKPECVLQNGDSLMINQKIVHVPTEYISDNFPIKNVSISDNLRHIAVSGRNGCTLYDTVTRKWRLFGDKSQEHEIVVTGLSWIDNDIICLVFYDKGYHFSLYPRNHLDKKSRLMTHAISSDKILAITYSNNCLLFYDERHVIYPFHIEIQTDKTTTVKLKKLTSFDSMIPQIPVIFRSLSASIRLDSLTGSFWYLVGQNLYLYDLKLQTSQLIEEKVDFAWMEDRYASGYLYFVHKHLKGTEVCFNNFSNCKISSLLIQGDELTLPLGCDKKSGMFVSLSTRHTNKFGIPHFEAIQTQIAPYHQILILNHLLNDTKVEKSLSNQPTFQICLEWLLSNIIVDDSNRFYCNSTAIGGSKNTQKLIRLVNSFPTLAMEIFVNCLRKIDSSLWNRLLEWIGTPKDVFAKANLVQSAHLLRIVEQTEGIHYAFSKSKEILSKCLKTWNYQLIKELAHYMSILESNVDPVVPDPIVPNWLWNNYMIQRFLLDHLKILISSGDLLHLMEFLTTFEFEQFPDWCRTESFSGLNMHKLFLQFHESLGLAHGKPVLMKWNHKNHHFFTNTQEIILKKRGLHESLTYLTLEFEKANQDQYALLIATLLCKMDTIQAHYRTYRSEYMSILKEYQYNTMMDYLK